MRSVLSESVKPWPFKFSLSPGAGERAGVRGSPFDKPCLKDLMPLRRASVFAHLEACRNLRTSRGYGAAERHRYNDVAVALRDTVTVALFRVCDLRKKGS